MMNKYRVFLGDYYATGEGTVISILIVDSNYPEELIKQKLTQVFDEYFASSVEEVDEKTLRNYESYLPRYVIGVLSGEVSTPGAFSWHSQFMVNYG